MQSNSLLLIPAFRHSLFLVIFLKATFSCSLVFAYQYLYISCTVTGLSNLSMSGYNFSRVFESKKEKLTRETKNKRAYEETVGSDRINLRT